MSRVSVLVLAVCLTLGCRGEVQQAAASSGEQQRPVENHRPIHVDSILPREEALRRFREGLLAPGRLSHAAATRKELIAAFLRAVEVRDTAALRGLTLTQEEFAYFYYPSTPTSMPPYGLGPDVMWYLISENSKKGLNVVLAKLGGSKLPIRSHSCDPAKIEGENLIHYPCRFVLGGPSGDTLTARLFGPIVERDGRFKLLSLANTLD
jgi:hypothetical protein